MMIDKKNIKNNEDCEKYSGFQGLINIVKKLRSKEGCPWDRKQTEETLKPYIIEEAYEVVDAISSGDKIDIMEELGDLLLQVIFLSDIYEEKKEFSLDNVINVIIKKLIRRHPHVFDANFSLKEGECLDDVILKNWERIKAEEKKEKQQAISSPLKTKNPSVYVSESLPALHRANMIQEKAKRLGLDFDNINDAFNKIYEELNELKNELNAIKDKPKDENVLNKIKEEYGDIIFSVVNIGRFLDIHPCNALNVSSNKFIKRFGYIEKKAPSPISELSPQKIDDLWEESKKFL